jgi:hypothetical protein
MRGIGTNPTVTRAGLITIRELVSTGLHALRVATMHPDEEHSGC